MRVYHIISKKDWSGEKDNRQFGETEIREYGFIHTSTTKGLQKIIKRYLDNENDYLILSIDIDEDLATYEDKDEQHLYPHFYSKIDRDCIADVIDLAQW